MKQTTFFSSLSRLTLRWFDSLSLRSILGAAGVVVGSLFAFFPFGLREPTIKYIGNLPPFLLPLLATSAGLLMALIVLKLVRDVQKESQDYAQKLTHRGTSTQSPEIVRLLSRLQQSNSQQIRDSVEQLKKELETSKFGQIDTSDPAKLFTVGRQRLLDEAVRIDSISRRNLIIGILFSAIALAFVAWPLIAQTLFLFRTTMELENTEPMSWLVRYYLPRFGVGVLLQFVGFFFLRLYVANENDLKHNKNEITNIEMRMMGLQLAQEKGDATSKKEVIKSLLGTERNFILKRNEKSVSNEALTEYNDLRGLTTS